MVVEVVVVVVVVRVVIVAVVVLKVIAINTGCTGGSTGKACISSSCCHCSISSSHLYVSWSMWRSIGGSSFGRRGICGVLELVVAVVVVVVVVVVVEGGHVSKEEVRYGGEEETD